MSLDTSLKILASAVAVYLLLQGAKRYFPGLCGRYAVIYNFLLSGVGAVLVQRPTSVAGVLAILAQTSGIAAGIHGTVKLLTKDQDAEGVNTPAAPGSLTVALITAGLLLPLAGCVHRVATAKAPAPLPAGAVDLLDATSNEVLQAAYAFASRISADTLSGKLKLTPAQRTAMARLNTTLNIADGFEQTYHACGLAKLGNPSYPACDTAALTAQVSLVQRAFSDADVAFAPTPSK